MSKKRTKKLKDDEPMPADVQSQADILDLQTPPPAPDPDFKDPDRQDVVEPTAEPPAGDQLDLFDDNHQIVDELEHYRTEITDQIAQAYDAIAKKKIEIQLLEDKRFAVKEAIDMALALLGKEAAPAGEPATEATAPTAGSGVGPVEAALTPELQPEKEKFDDFPGEAETRP